MGFGTTRFYFKKLDIWILVFWIIDDSEFSIFFRTDYDTSSLSQLALLVLQSSIVLQITTSSIASWIN